MSLEKNNAESLKNKELIEVFRELYILYDHGGISAGRSLKSQIFEPALSMLRKMKFDILPIKTFDFLEKDPADMDFLERIYCLIFILKSYNDYLDEKDDLNQAISWSVSLTEKNLIDNILKNLGINTENFGFLDLSFWQNTKIYNFISTRPDLQGLKEYSKQLELFVKKDLL